MSRTENYTGRLLEQLPPHAIEAEMCVLGSALIDATKLDEVGQIIRPDDFYKPANGAIFRAMFEIYNKTQALDIVQLHMMLVDNDTIEAVGGQEYLIELANTVPSADHAEHYARLVRDKSTLRQTIELAGKVLQSAYASPADPTAVIEQAEVGLFALSQRTSGRSPSRIDEHFTSSIDSCDRVKQSADALPTGLSDLDRMIGGLVPGEFIIIAARPSMGKTALAINITAQLASHEMPVGFFSLEMNTRPIALRIISTDSGVSSHAMRRRMLSVEQFSRMYTSAGNMTPLPLYVDESIELTMMQLRSKARVLVVKHGVRALFIDYLQLLKFDRRTETIRMEIVEISRAMKALARELNVPVVCMSQLNRGPESRPNHRPRLSDLKESGSLEQDADLVMLLHREDYYHQDDPRYTPTNIAELIIAKQRNGPTGTVRLNWHGDTMTFRGLSEQTYLGGAA